MKRAPLSQAPTFEHIVTAAGESFLWRLDDYPWQRNGWNYHPECEIHLIRRASGVAFVGDHIGAFAAGDVYLVGSGLPHDWVTALTPGQVIAGRDIVIQVHPDRLRQVVGTLPEFSALEALFSRASRGLSFTGATRTQAAALIEQMGPVSGLRRLALFVQLLDVLAQSAEFTVLSSPDFAPRLDAEALDVLQRVLMYIFNNFAADLRLADVAALAGMSESAFSRFFKKTSGNSFTDHINSLRLWQACKLLTETDLPVTQICFEVGYVNISNFNRTFLRRYHMTPSAYRRAVATRKATPAFAAQQ